MEWKKIYAFSHSLSTMDRWLGGVHSWNHGLKSHHPENQDLMPMA